MSFPGLQTGLGEFLLSLLGRHIAVLSPGELTLYLRPSRAQAHQARHTLKTPENHPPKWAALIVAREHYLELNHFFPIPSYKDLARAVPFQAPELCPEPFAQYRYVAHAAEGGHRVTLWFFRESVRPWTDWLRPWAVIPETALLGLSSDHDRGTAPIRGALRWNRRILVFAKNDGTLVSRLFPANLAETEAHARFRRLVGFEAGQAENSPVKAEEASEYVSRLGEKLPELPLAWWRRFLCLEKFRPPQFSRPFLYAQAALILLFFLVPWIASLHQVRAAHRDLTEKAREMGEQVGKYQEINDRLLANRGLIQRMQAPLAEYVPRSLVLVELKRRLEPEKDVLRSLRIQGGRMELRGETGSSSDLLTRLNQWPGFTQGRFSMPVRKDDETGRERFAIELILNPEGARRAATESPPSSNPPVEQQSGSGPSE